MKIALVSPYDYPYPGGVTEHINHLDENFRQLGHEVKILAPSSTQDSIFDGDRVYKVGSVVSIPANGSVARIALSPRLTWRVKNILAAENFDVVHIHEPLMPALPLTVLHYSKAANIGTFHASGESSLAYFYGKPILKRFFKHLDGRIAVSQAAKDFVGERFKSEYTIIPNGIDVNRFQVTEDPLACYRDDCLNILFVGRFNEKRKGFKYLLRAFSIVSREMPNVRLIVVGRGKDKGYQRYLRKNAVGNVIFAGYVSDNDISRYYASADVFCAPSIGGESFGIVLLEAMAAGKAVVASNINGYSAVVSDGVDGILAEPRNEQALAQSLIRALTDVDLRRRLGACGRDKAMDFSWEKVSRRVLNYYEQVVQQKAEREGKAETKPLVTADAGVS
jgi:phosphatidyl-myo-inositol alpha-mannosyltransferase